MQFAGSLSLKGWDGFLAPGGYGVEQDREEVKGAAG
jgi:hypothetical protein